MRIRQVMPLLVITLSLSATARAAETGMTDEDREHLLVHFEMTGQVLAEQVRGLSQAQLEYRLTRSLVNPRMRFSFSSRRARLLARADDIGEGPHGYEGEEIVEYRCGHSVVRH